jgi:hypothetical protein
LPFTRRMSLTFMAASLGRPRAAGGVLNNIAHNPWQF